MTIFSRAREGTNYPPDATIQAKQFVIRDFVVGSSIAIFGNVTADGTKVKVIHREHDAAIHALAAHPSQYVYFCIHVVIIKPVHKDHTSRGIKEIS